jgi:serine/threonine protein kinase
MLRQVASGLSFLHRHGILHGEVKVLLTLKTRERKKSGGIVFALKHVNPPPGPRFRP